MSVYILLQKATITVQNYTDNKNTFLKRIGSLFKSQAKLRKAVKLLRENQHLIKQLKTGSKEEQDFAAQIERVVTEYNKWIEKGKKRLRPVPGYILPTAFKCHTQEQLFRPIKNEDLLWMRKVSVTNLPKNILTKYQIGTNTFETLPGEVFVFTDSSYMIKSQQTGYPDPALLPGAFPECFLPKNYHLIRKKAEIAEGLLPKGIYNAQARLIYNLQKELDFRLHHAKFLAGLKLPEDLALMHRQVNKAFDTKIDLDPAAERLFKYIKQQPRQKLALITTYQQLFFYKLLHMRLDKSLFTQEIEKYYSVLTSLKNH